jgi:hypothetical protein
MMDRTASLHALTIAAGLLIAWRVITVNAVVYDEAGRQRLTTNSESPAASLVAILQRNPGEVAALVALAQERERAGEVEAAGRAYEAALAIAPVDRDVLTLAANFSLRHGRTAAAVAQFDRLVENYGEYAQVFPVFGQLLAARDPAVEAIAARNPGWMGAFIIDGCRRNIDPGLLALLLQRRGTRAQAAEVDCVTERLRTAGRWDESYLAWLNSLPRERLADVGFVFNGSFEHGTSGVGFDWRIARGSERDLGHAVMFAPAPGGVGQRALRVTYNGKRQAGPAIEEYLAVPAGRYEFSGLARMDKLNSVRGLQWTVRCQRKEGAAQAIASSERFLGVGEWRRFAFEVVVPKGCDGQVLQLVPVGMDEGTTYLAGTAWFDDLRLTRAR